MLESYEKRFNLLIHGIIDENLRYAWETQEQTKHLVEDFMKEDLKIEDPSRSPWLTVTDYLKELS